MRWLLNELVLNIQQNFTKIISTIYRRRKLFRSSSETTIDNVVMIANSAAGAEIL
jgi:hypothetical protein